MVSIMKKFFFLVIFIICLSFVINYSIHCINEETNSLLVAGSNKYIMAEIQKISKEEMETIETQKILSENRESLDVIIKRLLAQIDANMAENYWLFGYDDKHIPTGRTSMEIYVDDLEEISYIAIITFGSELSFNVEGVSYRFCTTIYAVFEGNAENLFSLRHSYSNSLEEAREALKLEENITQRKYIYVDTMESYEWLQPQYQEYRLEDLERTEIYRNFDVLIQQKGGFYFLPETEVYLGLWNGYSQETRIMYKIETNNGGTNYYMAEIGLDGTRRGYINITTKDVYERFKLIAVKMK